MEENLLRNSLDSYCIINEGSSEAIVLGISNDINALVKSEDVKNDNISLIRRFTAGGCVFVDENTIFVTFILSKKFLEITLFPESILRWAESFYKKVFEGKNFKLVENDFVIKDKKVAGNAMYIKKDRFLLHTSFLLNFDIAKLQKYLQIPEMAPKYRKNRSHANFLSSIKTIFSKDVFIAKIKKAMQNSFDIQLFDLSNVQASKTEYSTKII